MLPQEKVEGENMVALPASRGEWVLIPFQGCLLQIGDGGGIKVNVDSPSDVCVDAYDWVSAS